MISNVDILAIGVHPDDIELGCGGTLIKHIKKGYRVGILDLTQGELGSRGNAKLRIEEGEASRKIMDAEWRQNLKMEDGFFQINKENLLAIVKIIRLSSPNIVLCNAPIDRHPDHGRACQLVLEACFYSGLRKIEIEDTTPHRPKAVYSYIQDKELTPDFVVDISDEINQKIHCILAFGSQFYNGDEDNGPKTPISSKQFLDFVKSKNAVYGRDIMVDYAEGFISHRISGVNDLNDLL